MTEDRDLSLETDRLEAVIETPPPSQPVVVIQYRSRGLPTYVAIPVLLLVAAGSVAVSYRLTSQADRAQAGPRASDETRKPAQQPLTSTEARGENAENATSKQSQAAAVHEIPTPLALNSQPIAPTPPATAPVASPPAAETKPVARPAASALTSPEKPAAPSAWPPSPVAILPRVASTVVPSPPPALAAVPPAPAAAPVVGAPPATVTRPPHGGAVAVGFSVPVDPDNPFADLAIARKPPALPKPLDPRPSPKAAEPEPIPADDQPLPDKTKLMQEIAEEAAQKKAEMRQLNDMKDRAREVVDAESLRRIEDDRVTFRRELGEILKTGGKEAGQQIDDLCNKYGRNYDDAIRGRVTYLLRHSTGRVTKDARVRQFRAFGVPEPGILDYLANELHHLVNTRNGPRTPDDVRVSAARQLLGIRLNRDAAGNGGELQAQSARSVQANPPGNRRVP
jgi:hypothetical protein